MKNKQLTAEQMATVKGGDNGNHVSNGMYYPEVLNGKGATTDRPGDKP